MQVTFSGHNIDRGLSNGVVTLHCFFLFYFFGGGQCGCEIFNLWRRRFDDDGLLLII